MSEAVDTVVDDILHRAGKHDFDPTANTRDLVVQSAELCLVELNDREIDEAVEEVGVRH